VSELSQLSPCPAQIHFVQRNEPQTEQRVGTVVY